MNEAADQKPTVSVAILAYNEEARLPETLAEILHQSLLERDDETVEIVVVANGCADDTAGVARRFLEKNAGVTLYSVHEIIEPGKTNAWNQLVRKYSAPSSSILIFVDADIRFKTRDTLERLVRGLREDKEAIASHGTSSKDLTLRKPRNALEYLSAAFSRQSAKTARGMLCGQLYAIRADFARAMHLPLGLLVDDGFVKHMVVTDGFKKPEDLTRLHYVDGVGNTFEGYLNPRQIFITQVRMCMGEVQIHLLKRDILRKLEQNPELPMEKYPDEDRIDGPRWLDGILREHLTSAGFWVMQPGVGLHRLRRLKRLPLEERVKNVPLALLGSAVDVVVAAVANQKLKESVGAPQVWR